MTLASRSRQPKQSMTSLSRSIARCLTPNHELLAQGDDVTNDQNSNSNPWQFGLLHRGQSEPNILDALTSRSMTSFGSYAPASDYAGGCDTESVTSSFSGQDFVDSRPAYNHRVRPKSPSPRVAGTAVSERFLRLSQGDLTAPEVYETDPKPVETSERQFFSLPRNSSVRRSWSLRDFTQRRLGKGEGDFSPQTNNVDSNANSIDTNNEFVINV